MMIETILAARKKTHGDYADQAALAQSLKRMLRNTRNWEKMDFCQAQSMEAFCDKISRVLTGDNDEIDHWQDISGYAQLVVKDLEARNGGSQTPEIPMAKLPVSIKKQEGDAPLNAPEFLIKQMEDDIKEVLKK